VDLRNWQSSVSPSNTPRRAAQNSRVVAPMNAGGKIAGLTALDEIVVHHHIRATARH
jgi:hypothetical protein